MSACDSCYQPGACCRDFVLGGFSKTFWVDEGNEPPQRWIAEGDDAGGRARPFFAKGPDAKRHFDESGREYAAWRFSCPMLGADGRCTQYERRPDACRSYEPGMDAMCVHYRGAEGGEGRAVAGYAHGRMPAAQIEDDDPQALHAWPDDTDRDGGGFTSGA